MSQMTSNREADALADVYQLILGKRSVKKNPTGTSSDKESAPAGTDAPIKSEHRVKDTTREC